MANDFAAREGLPVLDLDTIAWAEPGVRLPLEESRERLSQFMRAQQGWVVEGCYASLVQHALPEVTRLIFLDPGLEACVRNNARRPWEPHKYASEAEQNAKLEFLQRWVREYYARADEYSHEQHLALYTNFTGEKTRERGGVEAASPVDER
jgi:adenylate kinase family enzyme